MTPKHKRVTAEHTKDRVRNNQRRHRARTKDYIATLEEKLAEAERTISTLRIEVGDLEKALRRDRHRQTSTPLIVGTEGVDIQEAPVVIDTDNLLLPIHGFVTDEPGEVTDSDSDGLLGMNMESAALALSIFQPAMFPSLSPIGDSLAYQSYQTNNNFQRNQSTTTVNTCCSPSIPPIGTGLSAELTRLCCEAYILIAQQNATVLKVETDGQQNPFVIPQLISCDFRMSCCLVKAEVSGPQVWTSISYIQCNS